MAILDEEIRLDSIEDDKAATYILSRLPEELKGKYTHDTIKDIMDSCVDYFAESDVLDEEADKEGFVDIPISAVCEELAAQRKSQGLEDIPQEDLELIVDTWLDFEEQQLD